MSTRPTESEPDPVGLVAPPLASGVTTVPFFDLTRQYASIRHEVDRAMARVVTSQHFVLGPVVERCERALARYVGTQHAIGVSSGSDALLVALMAEGIGAGDEVITTPYTFFATAGAIVRSGATPVFVDVDPVTLNINPDHIARRISGKTRAIIPVHLFGQMADMRTIMEIALHHDITVIEDAAQAIGARHNRQSAGTIGHYGCFSFFPTKNLGAYGNGGLITTDDPVRASLARRLRVHGAAGRYLHRDVGGNFRLDALQAAVLHAKLAHLDRWSETRRANAAHYNQLLSDVAGRGAQGLTLPRATTDRHVFNQYVVRVRARDRIRARLADAGVGTSIYYPVPLHRQPCFRSLGYHDGDLPASERAASQALALPIFPELSGDEIRAVADALISAVTI